MMRTLVAGIFAAAALAASPSATTKPAAAPAGVPADGGGPVHWLKLDGTITPSSAEYVARGVRAAEDEGATVLVIEMDTPGGRVDATREIVKSELNARIPVVVWVGPRGARAGSAGVFITLAANVAAMAPGTEIGAAHPIGIGPPDFVAPPDDASPSPAPAPAGSPAKGATTGSQFHFKSDQEHLAQKLENDTIAWVEGISRQRGRNVAWSRDAVLNSVSIVAEDALQKNVIDLIATDREALLSELDGRLVTTAAGQHRISSLGAHVVEVDMSWRETFVAFLANPTLLSILTLVVMLGLYTEFNHPGAVLPATLAGFALLFLLIGVQVVPVNYAGLLLIALGFVCFILEIKIVSYGMLTVGGAAGIGLGLFLLVDPTTFTVPVSWPLAVPAIGTMVAIAVFITILAARAMRATPLGDARELIGRVVRTATRLAPGVEGKVVLDGVFWNAASADTIEAGAAVRIVEAHGLLLRVAPAVLAPNEVVPPVAAAGGSLT
jgi:membrane-bound serine protease (ClpP class)